MFLKKCYFRIFVIPVPGHQLKSLADFHFNSVENLNNNSFTVSVNKTSSLGFPLSVKKNFFFVLFLTKRFFLNIMSDFYFKNIFLLIFTFVIYWFYSSKIHSVETWSPVEITCRFPLQLCWKSENLNSNSFTVSVNKTSSLGFPLSVKKNFFFVLFLTKRFFLNIMSDFYFKNIFLLIFTFVIYWFYSSKIHSVETWSPVEITCRFPLQLCWKSK